MRPAHYMGQNRFMWVKALKLISSIVGQSYVLSEQRRVTDLVYVWESIITGHQCLYGSNPSKILNGPQAEII
jgi:hypothetical protein